MSWIRFATLACATFVASAAGAQTSAPLSFADAAHKTLASHPQFKRITFSLQAAQVRAEAVALRPPVEMSAEIENVGVSGEVRGFDNAEITLSLTSLLERGGKRDARMEAAGRAVELLSVEQRIEMLDLLAETGRRFVAVASA